MCQKKKKKVGLSFSIITTLIYILKGLDEGDNTNRISQKTLQLENLSPEMLNHLELCDGDPFVEPPFHLEGAEGAGQTHRHHWVTDHCHALVHFHSCQPDPGSMRLASAILLVTEDENLEPCLVKKKRRKE